MHPLVCKHEMHYISVGVFVFSNLVLKYIEFSQKLHLLLEEKIKLKNQLFPNLIKRIGLINAGCI
jgi:hypothetical protein